MSITEYRPKKTINFVHYTKSLFIFIENEINNDNFFANNEEDKLSVFIKDESYNSWNPFLKEIKSFPAIFEISSKGEILNLK